VLQSQEGEQGRSKAELLRIQRQLEEAQRDFDVRSESSAAIISSLESKLEEARLVSGEESRSLSQKVRMVLFVTVNVHVPL